MFERDENADTAGRGVDGPNERHEPNDRILTGSRKRQARDHHEARAGDQQSPLVGVGAEEPDG
jgi:hypothetical protein